VLDQPVSSGLGRSVVDVQPPAEAIVPAARSRTIADRSTSGEPIPAPTTAPTIAELGLEQRFDTSAPAASRYCIGDLLGTGATSHVYAARDRTFDREVAIKFLEAGLAADGKRLARFLREARITARLDHPNIVPVYDLDSTPNGDLYLTMRRVSGQSLGDGLRTAMTGAVPAELGDWNRRVNILLKICDALACAHDRGIAHQDVKPDNIMLGPFGEVVLVDWGAARPFDEEPRAIPRITGTPAYMSPEQAAGQPADILADIYCLGATLFHALTLRHPTWASDDKEFWAKKRNGIIDPPTAAERALIPKRLLAIALKAMASERSERYASVKALAEDLQHYQAGLAVSAYRDSWIERILRWHRAHARPFWLSLAAVAAVLASALAVYGERVKEVAAWGSPIYRQEFADQGWRDDFAVSGEGARWDHRDGRAVSAGPTSNFLFLNRRWYGPVAVEVEGEILPGQPECDLSLAWSAEDPIADPKWLREGAYLLQTGSFDNTFAGIMNGGNSRMMVKSPIRLKSGVRYRLRFEIDHDCLSIDLDGKRICDYRAAFPCTSGYLGLYAYYPGKAFDHLTIWNKNLPQRVAPTAIGDSWYQRGQPKEAAEQYRLVAESFMGTALGDEARYKQGLCQAKLGQREAALRSWADLRDPRVQANAECQRIEWLIEAGEVATACARFTALYQTAPDIRQRLHLVFASAIASTLEHARPEDTDRWLALANDVLPSDLTVDSAAAQALVDLRRWDAVLMRYPHIGGCATTALLALGRAAEAVARYPDSHQKLPLALLALGRFEEVLRDHSSKPKVTLMAFWALGRFEDSVAYHHALFNSAVDESIVAGRADTVLAQTAPGTRSWYAALIHLGRLEEAVAAAVAAPDGDSCRVLLRARRYDQAQAAHGSYWQAAQIGKWLAALERHDVAAAEAARAAVQDERTHWQGSESWFARFILVEVMRHQGDPAALATAMRALAARGANWLGQRPWHAARYLLGELDDSAYLVQPACGHAPSALLVLRAIRADQAGDRAAALADYRAYLALPLHQRGWEEVDGDPITDHFVAWRVAELAPTP